MGNGRLAILGASHFQNPLILKAREMGFETHVFAWECGDVGERTADAFHPVSIVEIDRIAEICRELEVEGVCSIGSDLANITVAHVAERLGLTANSLETVRRSTNKHLMREAFSANGDPSPKSVLVREGELPEGMGGYPLIVKPVDRSGSRGVTKVEQEGQLREALESAWRVSFEHAAVVEEFVIGEEFSVEYASWGGAHTFLALTKKYTTGAPDFIETGHLEPAPVPDAVVSRIRSVVEHALDGLGVRFGASHSEVLLTADGQVRIVEIGSRMGGDCIGSALVPLSTGIDFVGAVVSVAVGREPDLAPKGPTGTAAIRFVLSDDDRLALERVRSTCPEILREVSPIGTMDHVVTDSSTRYGHFIMRADSLEELADYLPR